MIKGANKKPKSDHARQLDSLAEQMGVPKDALIKAFERLGKENPDAKNMTEAKLVDKLRELAVEGLPKDTVKPMQSRPKVVANSRAVNNALEVLEIQARRFGFASGEALRDALLAHGKTFRPSKNGIANRRRSSKVDYQG